MGGNTRSKTTTEKVQNINEVRVRTLTFDNQ